MFEKITEKNSGGNVAAQLMTYEEYSRNGHPLPYVYEIEDGAQKLTYFGAEHSFDPEDEQVARVKGAWEEFLRKVDRQNAVVFVEGGARDSNEESEAIAIHEDGETGLSTYLANQEHVPVFSPEPNTKEVVDQLKLHFKADEILYYFFARGVAQWHRLAPQPEFDTYLQGLFSDEAVALGYDPDILGELSQTHERLFGKKLDIQDVDHFDQAEDPITITSVSNEVARATSILRDKHIMGEVENKWKEGKSIFIVYGASHAVMQEPALRSMLTKTV